MIPKSHFADTDDWLYDWVFESMIYGGFGGLPLP